MFPKHPNNFSFHHKRFHHYPKNRIEVLSFDTLFLRRQISKKDSFAKLTTAKLSLWLPSHRVRIKIAEKCENDEEQISADDTQQTGYRSDRSRPWSGATEWLTVDVPNEHRLRQDTGSRESLS